MPNSLEAVEIIENCLREYTVGWNNREARSIITRAAYVIEHDPENCGYVSSVLASLKAQTDILYSPRKHARYGGVDAVKSQALADCLRLRQFFRRPGTSSDSGTSAGSDKTQKGV
jgi:hypothetical protein